jgi:hypothetical protein
MTVATPAKFWFDYVPVSLFGAVMGKVFCFFFCRKKAFLYSVVLKKRNRIHVHIHPHPTRHLKSFQPGS